MNGWLALWLLIIGLCTFSTVVAVFLTRRGWGLGVGGGGPPPQYLAPERKVTP